MEITIPDNALWILFLILLIIFAVYGSIFAYHWNHYGISGVSKKVARVAYFFISIVILSAIAFFIGIYNF